MKKEYEAYLKATQEFLDKLKAKEERILLLDQEYENKRKRKMEMDDEMANQARLQEMMRMQANDDVRSIKNNANEILKKAEMRLIEVEAARLSALKEREHCEKLKNQLLADLSEKEANAKV
jgi:hypothetical protein